MAELKDMPDELRDQLVGLPERYALMVCELYDLSLAAAEGPPITHLARLHDLLCPTFEALDYGEAAGIEAPAAAWAELHRVMTSVTHRIARYGHLAVLRERGEIDEFPSPEEIERTDWDFYTARPENLAFEIATFDGSPPPTDGDGKVLSGVDTRTIEPVIRGAGGAKLGWDVEAGAMVVWGLADG